ncbi:MAG: lipocalin-like domain-containing protein [Pseudomonadota bacterium]
MSQPDLHGIWTLVDFSFEDPGGGMRRVPMQGRLHYLHGGLMSAHLMSGALSAEDEDTAGGFRPVSYCGAWHVDGDTVRHTVELASVRAWIGSELARRIVWDGDTLVLIAERARLEDMTGTARLSWVRAGEDA